MKKSIFTFTLTAMMIAASVVKAQNNSNEADFKSYSKFDFVPGEQIIYFEDFAKDAIGDFPDKWNTNSSAEVVTVGNLSGKWLKTVNEGLYKPQIKTNGFPDNYTIEFDAVFFYLNLFLFLS